MLFDFIRNYVKTFSTVITHFH